MVEKQGEPTLDEQAQRLLKVRQQFEEAVSRELKREKEMPPLIEVTEPMELENQKPVYFKAKDGSFTRFYFQVDKECVIKVKTWPLDRESEPDLYMTVDQEEVNSDVNHWKSNRIGADEIVIYPDNPKFKTGLYRVAVEAFRGPEEHKFGIQILVKEAKPVVLLENTADPTPVTVHDSAFFKYVLQDTSDLERMFLLLNITNRERLQVYIHKRNYPSELPDEHEFAVGDLPDHVLQRMFQMYYMKEMYQDANPFQYVKALDTVAYYSHFRHTNPAY